MKGLTLAENYFRTFCLPALQNSAPHICDRVAAGLVGEGSESFGYDDELSQDHDFTPMCSFWLSQKDVPELAPELERILGALPQFYDGFTVTSFGMRGDQRRGIWSIEDFFCKYIGVAGVPETALEWLRIPETSLALVTNGKVFLDSLGQFSAIRSELLAHYPDDILRLKLASRCVHMAQSGQYNYRRCMLRGELTAARIAETEFIQEVIHMVYLLNRRYMPYYKWAHRGLAELPLLGHQIQIAVNRLVRLPADDWMEHEKQIEEICQWIIRQLRTSGFSNASGDFLMEHGDYLQSTIRSENLRQIPPMAM